MLLRGRPGSFDPSHLLPAAPQLPPFTSFLSDITLPFFSPLSTLRKVELRIPVLILYYPEGTHTSLALFSGKAARAARCPRLGANRPTRMEYTSRGRRHLASWKILWIGAFFPVRSRMKTFEPVVHVHWFQFEPSSPKIPPLFLCCEVVITTQRRPVSALHLFSPLGQISSRLLWPAKPSTSIWNPHPLARSVALIFLVWRNGPQKVLGGLASFPHWRQNPGSTGSYRWLREDTWWPHVAAGSLRFHILKPHSSILATASWRRFWLHSESL